MMRFLTTQLVIVLILAVVGWEGVTAQRRNRWRYQDSTDNIVPVGLDSGVALTDEELRFLFLLNKFQSLKGQATTTTIYATPTPTTTTTTTTPETPAPAPATRSTKRRSSCNNRDNDDDYNDDDDDEFVENSLNYEADLGIYSDDNDDINNDDINNDDVNNDDVNNDDDDVDLLTQRRKAYADDDNVDFNYSPKRRQQAEHRFSSFSRGNLNHQRTKGLTKHFHPRIGRTTIDSGSKNSKKVFVKPLKKRTSVDQIERQPRQELTQIQTPIKRKNLRKQFRGTKKFSSKTSNK